MRPSRVRSVATLLRRAFSTRSLTGGFPTAVLGLSLLLAVTPVSAQRGEPLKTPLPDDLIQLFANELSGQAAFDNLVRLAGAPWLRSEAELTGETNFYESGELYRMARAYGIETVRLDRYATEGTFDYPLEGELRVDGRRVGRIPSDAALIASGTRSGEVTGPLVYVPDISDGQMGSLLGTIEENPGNYRGAVALMWSHPRGDLFQALDRAGVRAVISFSSRDRYFDPDQVVYSGGSYGQGENLTMGFTVSWRQWSEMLEDLQRGMDLQVEARAVMGSYPNRYETVYAWIPGTEPEEKGVVFTGHLFEGYTKRGANDDMGGPAIQLEILRALNHLIETGQIPRPRRTIHFIWPQEISGTYEFMKRDPALAGKLAININMDMVSEGLRNANSWFTMSETPAHLASFYDGLAASVLNYIWRTNDIVYLPGAPRGRPGGQYFPDPLWEKNGSRDAFRFFIHEATGGSDHLVFNNPSIGVPGIEFFTWPDQWYHADSDTPDKADPTEMRRVAFLGAATAWVSANLQDEWVPDLLDAVGDFGYDRVAERGIPRALEILDQAAAEGASGEAADAALARSGSVLAAATRRELEAIGSIREIYSGSAGARAQVDARSREWESYAGSLVGYLQAAAEARGLAGARVPAPGRAETNAMGVVPLLAPGIRAVETSLSGFAPMRTWLGQHPTALEDLGLSRAQTTQIVNFINGKRPATEILYRVRGVTGEDLTLAQLQGYLGILEEVGWITLRER